MHLPGSKMDLFKFYEQYGKELKCPNIGGKFGKNFNLKNRDLASMLLFRLHESPQHRNRRNYDKISGK